MALRDKSIQTRYNFKYHLERNVFWKKNKIFKRFVNGKET